MYGAILNGMEDAKNDEVGYDKLFAVPTCAFANGNGGRVDRVALFESELTQVYFLFSCFSAFDFSLPSFSSSYLSL